MKQKKLKRDCVISIVNGKDLVGVYFADTDVKSMAIYKDWGGYGILAPDFN